jgi:hypothetical protein
VPLTEKEREVLGEDVRDGDRDALEVPFPGEKVPEGEAEVLSVTEDDADADDALEADTVGVPDAWKGVPVPLLHPDCDADVERGALAVPLRVVEALSLPVRVARGEADIVCVPLPDALGESEEYGDLLGEEDAEGEREGSARETERTPLLVVLGQPVVEGEEEYDTLGDPEKDTEDVGDAVGEGGGERVGAARLGVCVPVPQPVVDGDTERDPVGELVREPLPDPVRLGERQALSVGVSDAEVEPVREGLPLALEVPEKLVRALAVANPGPLALARPLPDLPLDSVTEKHPEGEPDGSRDMVRLVVAECVEEPLRERLYVPLVEGELVTEGDEEVDADTVADAKLEALRGALADEEGEASAEGDNRAVKVTLKLPEAHVDAEGLRLPLAERLGLGVALCEPTEAVPDGEGVPEALLAGDADAEGHALALLLAAELRLKVGLREGVRVTQPVADTVSVAEAVEEVETQGVGASDAEAQEVVEGLPDPLRDTEALGHTLGVALVDRLRVEHPEEVAHAEGVDDTEAQPDAVADLATVRVPEPHAVAEPHEEMILEALGDGEVLGLKEGEREVHPLAEYEALKEGLAVPLPLRRAEAVPEAHLDGEPERGGERDSVGEPEGLAERAIVLVTVLVVDVDTDLWIETEVEGVTDTVDVTEGEVEVHAVALLEVVIVLLEDSEVLPDAEALTEASAEAETASSEEVTEAVVEALEHGDTEAEPLQRALTEVEGETLRVRVPQEVAEAVLHSVGDTLELGHSDAERERDGDAEVEGVPEGVVEENGEPLGDREVVAELDTQPDADAVVHSETVTEDDADLEGLRELMVEEDREAHAEEDREGLVLPE